MPEGFRRRAARSSAWVGLPAIPRSPRPPPRILLVDPTLVNLEDPLEVREFEKGRFEPYVSLDFLGSEDCGT